MRALPPETSIEVTLRPVQAITRPMQMSAPGGKPASGPSAADPAELPKNVVEIDRVAVADDTGGPGKPARPSSLEPGEWLERVKAQLSADELVKLEQMHRNMTPDEIHRRHGGDFDLVLDRVKAATAKGQAVTDRTAASRRRAEELRQAIDARGLMKSPRIREILDRLGPGPSKQQLKEAVEPIRGELMTEIAAAEAQLRYPGSRVHKDVKVWVEQPEATKAEWKANNPGHEGVHAELPTPSGMRVHVLSTDIDVLVVQPRTGGKARIVHREELKTGKGDTHAKAMPQLDKGLRRLEEAASGQKTIRLFEDDVDITAQIDLTTASSSTGVTRGPAGKGFDQSHGISAKDLERMVQERIELEVRLRDGE